VTAGEKLKAVRKALVRYDSGPFMMPIIQDLLDIIDDEDTPEPEAEPEFSPADLQRLHELAERLTWTCEGCGGKLIGGQPPRCIGCRPDVARRMAALREMP
jgi:hypothetical protein